MTMYSDRRRYARHATCHQVLVKQSETDCGVAQAIDWSEGGVFVSTPQQPAAKVGDPVSIQVIGMFKEKAPEAKLRVVRRCGAGLGLQFEIDDAVR